MVEPALGAVDRLRRDAVEPRDGRRRGAMEGEGRRASRRRSVHVLRESSHRPRVDPARDRSRMPRGITTGVVGMIDKDNPPLVEEGKTAPAFFSAACFAIGLVVLIVEWIRH